MLRIFSRVSGLSPRTRGSRSGKLDALPVSGLSPRTRGSR